MGSSVVDLGPRLAVVLGALTVVAAVAGRVPGAFVGVLLGGGSPLEAGAAQLLVLVGLLATQVVAVWAVVELVARGRLLTDVPA
ncbi:ABC transporter permease [Geodermatophilus sp. CPCC 206100]|uniref:ABC transporter permease n=1 Tax=Geodermatophilus sp. CPCC 206100 TaxID=3020054 RepID=UPI003B005A8B